MKKIFMKKMSALVLGMSMLAISAVNVSAAPSDCIDVNAKASFTIHRYDAAAAKENGIRIETAGFASNGKEDSTAEEDLKNNVIQGVEFTYAKVGDINTDSEGGRLQVLYDIPEKLENILMSGEGREENQYTSTELNQALLRTLSDNTAGKTALERFMAETDGKQAMPLTDDKGETKAAELLPGLYFIVETKVPANVYTTTDPFFMSLPMTDEEGDAWFYDVDVYPKNQTDYPDLDKLVKQHDDVKKGAPYEDTATASCGEILDYIFVSHLPSITSEATFLEQYTFEDMMDSGLAYNDDFEIYFFDSEESARSNIREQAKVTWEKGTPNFTVEYDTEPIDSRSEKTHKSFRTATIRMTEEGLKEINSRLSRMYMTVSYSCTVNSDSMVILGDKGNVNDVELTWNRTSSEYTDTIRDRAKVYVFGLNIKKSFEQQEGGKGDPKQVQFILQNKTDGYFVTAGGSEDGVYYITDGIKAEDEKQASVFVPSKDGTLKINGLEADTYVLTEIATDDGYSLLREPMTVEIKCTVDDIIPSKPALYDSSATVSSLIESEGERARAEVDQRTANMSEYQREDIVSTNARADLNILNSRSFKLPQTGGYGTIFFTLAGCGSALTGVILLTRKSGKDKKEV